ncbi:OmpA family protein [Aquimarina rhabdastrellae]
MNLYKTLSILIALAILTSSCSAIKNANNTQKGAVIGATSGAVLGGIIGNNVKKKNSALGAIIGGVVGGLAGGIIGKQMDKQAQKIEEEIPGAEVTRVGEGINVVFDENSGVYFATNSYALNAKSKANLNKLIGIFKEFPDTNITVEGHTDNRGNADYNLTLSKNRAESVVKYLTSKGLNPYRFQTFWHGESLPKYTNDTAEGRAKNRRVELGIVANEEMKKKAQQQGN